MPLNPDAVGSQSEPVDVSWTSKDALLYAVGIGAGGDELAFTTENTNGVDQQVFPTFPVVLGWGGARRSARSARSTRRCSSTASRPSRCTGRSRSRARRRSSGSVVAMYDKEQGGRRRHRDRGRRWTASRCTPTARSVFIRGEGGWGGERGPSGPQNVPPERRPITRSRYQTSPDQALRLPPLRRPQPAAHRPVVRRDGRLRPPDPARPVQLRLHRPGAAARAVRVRPGAVPPHRGPVRVAGAARRRR